MGSFDQEEEDDDYDNNEVEQPFSTEEDGHSNQGYTPDNRDTKHQAQEEPAEVPKVKWRKDIDDKQIKKNKF